MSLEWKRSTLKGRKMFFLALCAVMTVTLAQPALAAEPSDGAGRFIHVAKDGSDSNPGTEAAPYLTINRAAQEAQPGDTVVVHAGLYRETVKPARGGTTKPPALRIRTPATAKW